MEQGKLLKKLRLERNISQAKLSQGICSRTTLTSCENRNAAISSLLLIQYLHRLNVTPHEFFSELNLLPQRKSMYATLFTTHANHRAIPSSFLQSVYSSYQETNDFFYYLMYIKGKLVNYQENRSGNNEDYYRELRGVFREEIQTVNTYLFTIDVWRCFELNVFSEFLFLFTPTTISHHLNTSLQKTVLFAQDPLYSDAFSKLILNGCYFASEIKDHCLLSQFLQFMDRLPNSANYYYLKSHRGFYQQILLFFNEEPVNCQLFADCLEGLRQATFTTDAEDLSELLRSLSIEHPNKCPLSSELLHKNSKGLEQNYL